MVYSVFSFLCCRFGETLTVSASSQAGETQTKSRKVTGFGLVQSPPVMAYIGGVPRSLGVSDFIHFHHMLRLLFYLFFFPTTCIQRQLNKCDILISSAAYCYSRKDKDSDVKQVGCRSGTAMYLAV